MLRPPPLRPGDRVAVVAPSSPFDRDRFERGLQRLAARYEPVLDQGLFESRRYLAGPDQVRARALAEAFADDAIRAVFAARGGSGAGRLLPLVDLGQMPLKPLVGFSDTTVLHAALQVARRVSVHGPVVTQLSDQPDWVLARLFAVLEGQIPEPLTGLPLVPGVVEGPLIGGDLAVFCTLLGTRWLPDLTGAVLLLEEVQEQPYKLDRLWTHARNAGVFERIAGIALGQFLDCDPADPRYGTFTGREVMRELVAETGLPSAAEFPIGHGEVNAPVALGARVRLDGGRGILQPLEAATA
jgi:muramoyltetrapeptide carboxypeptidase